MQNIKIKFKREIEWNLKQSIELRFPHNYSSLPFLHTLSVLNALNSTIIIPHLVSLSEPKPSFHTTAQLNSDSMFIARRASQIRTGVSSRRWLSLCAASRSPAPATESVDHPPVIRFVGAGSASFRFSGGDLAEVSFFSKLFFSFRLCRF